MNIKQIIVMRTDLGMRKGKMVSQGAHASMLWLTKSFCVNDDNQATHEVKLTDDQKRWIYGTFTKICVGVNSELELLQIYDTAKKAGLTVEIVTDSGVTEFHGIPTRTCLAIGPNKVEEIDKITGHLKLL